MLFCLLQQAWQEMSNFYVYFTAYIPLAVIHIRNPSNRYNYICSNMLKPASYLPSLLTLPIFSFYSEYYLCTVVPQLSGL